MPARAQQRKWGDRAAKSVDVRQAAAAILARDGLERLTMRAVAEQAGVSLGAVYTHFPSKEALFATLYAERLDQLATDLERDCAKATTTEEVLALIAERYFEVYAVFGRELNVWSLLVSSSATAATPPEIGVRLAGAAMRVFDIAFETLKPFEPWLARV